MVREFMSEDEGKKVMTNDGDEVGIVKRVSGKSAEV